MEACDIDQFEMHLRAVLGLPCPQPTMRVGAAVMVNVLGGASMDDTTVYALSDIHLLAIVCTVIVLFRSLLSPRRLC